jgi:hypothetical protein
MNKYKGRKRVYKRSIENTAKQWMKFTLRVRVKKKSN